MRSSRAAELVERWWAGQLGGAGRLLAAAATPLEFAYGAIAAARNAAYDRGIFRVHRLPVPVVSVGNLGVGGAGKTPVAAWLVAELRRLGRRPALLHGGYAADEPELHRRWAPDVPVIAERDRVAGAALALAAGADVLVLDDAFQHRRIGRDLDLLLVPAERWPAPVRLLPRGPWRERASAARRATLIALTSRTPDPPGVAAAEAELHRRAPGVPLIRLHLAPAGWLHEGVNAGPPAEPALAVAAIADPGAFAAGARAAGATIADTRFWRDHHDYSSGDARAIQQAAGAGPVVTTEKDWVKLERLLPSGRVWILRQEVRVMSGGAELAAALAGLWPA